jgi:hypothetical protein
MEGTEFVNMFFTKQILTLTSTFAFALILALTLTLTSTFAFALILALTLTLTSTFAFASPLRFLL